MRDWLSRLFRKRPATTTNNARTNNNQKRRRMVPSNAGSPARPNRPNLSRASRTNVMMPNNLSGYKRARNVVSRNLTLAGSPNRTKRARTNLQRLSPSRPQRWWAMSVATTTSGTKRRRNNTHTSTNNAARIAHKFVHSRRLN